MIIRRRRFQIKLIIFPDVEKYQWNSVFILSFVSGKEMKYVYLTMKSDAWRLKSSRDVELTETLEMQETKSENINNVLKLCLTC